MAKKVYKESNIQAIADSIREKTGTTTKYTTAKMAGGVSEVYDAGKKSQYDEFWDTLQNNGDREYYGFGFTYWGCDEIIPKYKVVPTRSNNIFAYSTIKRINRDFFDLSKATVVNTASGTSGGYSICLGCSNLEVFPDMGLRAGSYCYSFQGCEKLHTIELLRVREEAYYSYGFDRTNSLQHINFEGVIGKSISFSTSPLSVESLKSIIFCLKNYAGTENEYTYTVTFKSTAFEALETAGFTQDDKTWLEELGISYSEDLTWAMVIDDMKWNLTLS